MKREIIVMQKGQKPARFLARTPHTRIMRERNRQTRGKKKNLTK